MLLTYVDYGLLLVGHDSPAVARDFIREGLKEYPESVELWYLLALTYTGTSSSDRVSAIEAAAKAHQLAPTNARVTALYNSLENDAEKYAADLVYHNDSSTATRNFIPQALKGYPESVELWLLLALAYTRSGEVPSAVEAAAQAYRLNPSEQSAAIYQSLKANKPFTIDYGGRYYTFSR